MGSQIKGTFIIRRQGRFYKVIRTRRAADNWWTFECRNLETKQNQVFKYKMLGMLEAMDSAARVMKDQKDILLIDLDNQGRWRLVTKGQLDRIVKE